MNTNTIMILAVVIFLLCVFALNWAIVSAYSGAGFYVFALANGLIIGVVAVLVWKTYKLKN
jgi:hypothetical protein